MKSGEMAMIWTAKEESHLLNVIPEYRQKIVGKNLKQARSITLGFAEEIHKLPEVKQRSVEAINQRIPYLENLLAGAFEKHHYAKKDEHLYLTSPRVNNSKKPNLCNTRHPYNGALRDYLDKLKKNPDMDGDFVI
jgi:hypothetical protein